MGIYKITNKADGKVYVGGTSNLRKRKNTHFSDLKRGKHKNLEFQREYNLFKREDFEFEVLEFVNDKGKLDEREDYWTNEFKSNVEGYGYNKRTVYVDTNLGIRPNDYEKMKISENRKGKGTGKRNHSPETVKLKSKLCKAQNLSQYHTEESETRRLESVRLQHCDIPILEKQKQSISEHNKGEFNGEAKLTEEKVLEILNMLKDKIPIKIIIEIFNVSRKTIYKISTGTSWKHITMPFLEENNMLHKQIKKSGSNNSQSKLTKEQAIEIIKAIEEHTATQKQLAEKYKVSKSTIGSIARGTTWTHLPRNKSEDIIEPYILENDYKIYNDEIYNDALMQTNL